MGQPPGRAGNHRATGSVGQAAVPSPGRWTIRAGCTAESGRSRRSSTVATYNLIYNALMVDEGMGMSLTLDKLVNTTGSHLCFRPLEPRLELRMYLVWKKSRIFSQGGRAVPGASAGALDQIRADA